jgi:toxin ParE1/3/4
MDVVVTFRARADILDAYSYLAERGPAAAERMLEHFSRRFDELSRFPFLGRGRSELGASLRGLLIDNYIAFYYVEADRVVIVRVIDGRMDFDEEFSK